MVRPSVHADTARQAGLDFLRFCAITAVVLYHCPHLRFGSWIATVASHGGLGVDLFFVLSGYLVAGSLFREIRLVGSFSFRDFYIRRIFRTWPAYFVILAVLVGLSEGGTGGPRPIWKFMTFLQNFSSLNGFGVSWSLCVEEHFYLVFPILVALILRVSKRYRRVTVICLFVGVILGGMLGRAALWFYYFPAIGPGWLDFQMPSKFFGYFLFPTYFRLDGLAFGSALAAWRNFFAPAKEEAGSLARYLWIPSFGVGAFAAQVGSGAGFVSVVTAFPLWAFTFVLLVASMSYRGRVAKGSVPIVSRIAAWSYSIYLTHTGVFHFTPRIAERIGLDSRSLAALGLSLGAVLLAGWILHRVVEVPFMNMRTMIGRKVEASLAMGRSEVTWQSLP